MAIVTRRDKLVARLRAGPPESAFADVRALLEHRGWSLAHQKGSHVTFTRPGERAINFPLSGGRWVKRPYVSILLRRLDAEE